MSLLQNSNAISVGGAYDLTDSVRFRSSSDAYLSWTPSSVGNRKTWTWSAWVKRGALDSNYQGLFSADTSSNRIYLLFDTDNSLRLDGNAVIIFDTSAVYRDCSAWYHIVLAVDTTQATASNRFKLYVNGTQITSFATDGRSSIAQNTDLLVNNTTIHNIGRDTNTTTRRFDGYMTEVNFVDGQALDASDFGEYDDTTGVWKPKKYTGTYGTNGFYLPMKATTQASGFNTVLYTGNGTSQSITGVGFQPDLVWFKSRSGVFSNFLVDSVRGDTKYLITNNTDAESTATNRLTSFDADGFSLGNGGGSLNGTNESIVAWCWEGGTPDTYSAIFNGSRRLEITSGISGNFTPTSGFTFECWIKPYNTTLSQPFFVGGGANSWSTSNGYVFGYINGSTGTAQWQWNNSGATHTLVLSTAPTVGEWNHLVVGYDGITTRIWLNGASQGTSTNGYTVPTTVDQVALGGRFSDFTNAFNGQLSNLRFVKGTDVYGVSNTSITVPTTNLTAITNTELLTFQDSTIQDNSTNNFTFTDYGNVITTQAFPYINNTNGSVSSTVSANTAKGFSIVSYTGSGGTGTVGHGLTSAPKMVIFRPRSVATHWRIWHQGLTGANYTLFFTTGAEQIQTAAFNSTAPTSSVVSLGSDLNTASTSYIGYCFAEVSGFSKFGSYTGNGSTSGPSITTGFRPAFIMFKRTDSTQNWIMFDNTRDVDGTLSAHLYADLTNAEASADTVSINDTGFQIVSTGGTVNTSGGSYIYMAFADTRDNQWNFDASGNKNNWTPNNINSNASSETTYDIMSDVPTLTNEDTGNYATWNFVHSNTAAAYKQDGNLTTLDDASNTETRSTISVSSGKWYAEYTLLVVGAGSSYSHWGVSKVDSVLTTYIGSNANTWGFFLGDGRSRHNASDNLSYGTGASVGDTIMCALDMDNNKVWWGKNGTWFSSGDPVAGTNAAYTNVTGNICFSVTPRDKSSVNFGQRPFKYTPPTGYKKLNTYNLPDSAVVDGSEYFDVDTWTGTGLSTDIQTPFSPDFVWIKDRSNARNHYLIDTVRGNDKTLISNLTDAEYTLTNTITSFNSDGYTILNNAAVNNSGETYVGWSWRGSDSTAVSNTDGDIAATVSANTTSGFSIVTYTGNGIASTIGHGLGVTPKVLIHKNRDVASDWLVRTTAIDGSWDNGYLNLTNAFTGSSATANTTTFSPGTGTIVNNNGSNHVAYCFAEVEGFSKFGSWETVNVGGIPAAGFVYTGFKPKLIIWKAADTSTAYTSWGMQDTERTTYNNDDETLHTLWANATYAEGARGNGSSSGGLTSNGFQIDFLSNGFNIKGGGNDELASSGTYIYMAWAENPFKNSLAR